jgi:hypothetical protein
LSYKNPENLGQLFLAHILVKIGKRSFFSYGKAQAIDLEWSRLITFWGFPEINKFLSQVSVFLCSCFTIEEKDLWLVKLTTPFSFV